MFAIPVNDPDSRYEYPEQVRLELEQEDLSSYERAAEFLNFNGNDLVCLQHEYGITTVRLQVEQIQLVAIVV